VEDRGVGFDVEEMRAARDASGFGLFSVREQIDRLGGTVQISSAPSVGTRVSMRVPVLRDPVEPAARASAPADGGDT
jgi:signal transduction histidine kinase